jgi:hypothetical protein
VSTIIIGDGGGGKSAVQKLVDNEPRMNASQKAAAKQLIEHFVSDVEALISAVEENG